MDSIYIGIIGVVLFLVFVCLGMPIAIAGTAVGIGGLFVLGGATATWGAAQYIPFEAVASFDLSSIPLFILMGDILFYCGVADGFFKAASRWLGFLPGGLASSTALASALMGTCTGSSAATTAVMAKMAYPQMRKAGYEAKLALGVTAGAGPLAAMIPPSIMAVIYAVLAEQSIGKLLVAGFIPGFVEALAFITMITLMVALNPHLAPKATPVTWRERFASLVYIVPAVIMMVVIVGGIYTGILIPSEAGAVAATVAFIIVLALKRLTWAKLKDILLDTCRLTVLVMVTLVGILFMTKFLYFSKAIVAFAELALVFPSPLITLLLMFLVYFALGMFVGATGMLMMTTPIFVPVIIASGYDPVWFGILVIKMCEIAVLTPPVAVNVFVAQGITRELTLEQATVSIIPYIVCNILTLGLFVLFPQIITFLPNIMPT